MKVILASGVGKLHLHETARAIAMAGVNVEFLTGWVPGHRSERAVNALGRLLGEASLAKRMSARSVEHPNVIMRPIAWSEFAGRAIAHLDPLKLLPPSISSGLDFRLAGWGSRKYLKDADIFQVRSGAGQGGAIRRARRNGLKVIADHSIAHPWYMESVLTEEYARAGLKFEPLRDDGLWRTVLKDCDDADLLLVNSDFVKRTFVGEGYPAERIRVAYLGVRESYFGLKTSYEVTGPVKILCTGNFNIRKGSGDLLAAIRKVRAGGLDVRLRFVGNMADGKIWLKDSDADFFTHTAFVAPDELRPMLAESDMFVFPTLIEGSSRSAMEAAAAGLPVITTENCGLPFEHGKSVFYVPLSDSDALAEAIARMATDGSLRQSIGTNAARAVANSYTWQNYGEQLLAIYESMVLG